MNKKCFYIICAYLLLSACAKSNTNWRDYGDYFSFNVGCYIDGKECHFQQCYLFRGEELIVCPVVYDSTIDLRFKCYNLSTTPNLDYDDCRRVLEFQVKIDSLSYDKSSRIKIRRDNNVEVSSELIDCIVHYYYRSVSTGLWTSFDFVDGWVSFDLGEIIAVDRAAQTDYHIHNVSQILFEFSFESEGCTHTIKDGYCYPKDYNIKKYYSWGDLTKLL